MMLLICAGTAAGSKGILSTRQVLSVVGNVTMVEDVDAPAASKPLI
jgi:hypothetical protein